MPVLVVLLPPLLLEAEALGQTVVQEGVGQHRGAAQGAVPDSGAEGEQWVSRGWAHERYRDFPKPLSIAL